MGGGNNGIMGVVEWELPVSGGGGKLLGLFPLSLMAGPNLCHP